MHRCWKHGLKSTIIAWFQVQLPGNGLLSLIKPLPSYSAKATYLYLTQSDNDGNYFCNNHGIHGARAHCQNIMVFIFRLFYFLDVQKRLFEWEFPVSFAATHFYGTSGSSKTNQLRAMIWKCKGTRLRLNIIYIFNAISMSTSDFANTLQIFTVNDWEIVDLIHSNSLAYFARPHD